MNSHEEPFHRLLDESSAMLAAPESAGLAIPDDDLHREIIVPLLPAMLADAAIRQHWSEQTATGFLARIARHFDGGDPAPRWLPGDFEIHVTASYSAGPDARALADTLLSEESLRDMTAALMNQLLDVLWPSLAPAPSAIPAEPQAAAEIPADEISVPVATEIPEPIIPSVPEMEPVSALPAENAEEILKPVILAPATEPEPAIEILPALQPVQPPPSRALIRALCRKLAVSAVQRGLIANGAHVANAASAAILARRILERAACRPPFGPTNRRPPHCSFAARYFAAAASSSSFTLTAA